MAGKTEREARIVFGWRYDEASQKRVEQGLDRINKATADQARTLGSYSAKTQAGLDAVAAGFSRGNQSSERMRESLREWEQAGRSVEGVASKINGELADMAYAAQIDNIANDAIKAAKASKDWAAALKLAATRLSEIGASDDDIQAVAQRIGAAAQGRGGAGGRAIGTLGRIGQEVRYLPSVQLGGGLSTDVIGRVLYTADKGLTALGASAGTVAAASGIAAPALVGLMVALAEFSRQLEGNKTQLGGALDAQTRYYTALSTMTSEQAAEEIETETRRLEFLRQQRAETQTALDSAFAQAQGTFSDPVARALDAAGTSPYNQLREQLNELDAQIASTEGYTTRLTGAQAEGAFAAGELTDREQELADARRARYNETVSAADRYFSIAGELTSEQARNAMQEEDARRRQLVAERDYLESQRDLYEEGSDAYTTYNDAITGLNTQINESRKFVQLLSDGLVANAFALNDAAEAERLRTQAAEDWTAGVTAVNDRLAQARIAAEREADQMTAGQRRQRVGAIQDEIDALTRLIEEGGLSAEYTDELWMQIAILRQEMRVLKAETESTADRMQAGAEATRRLKEAMDGVLDANTRYVNAQQKLFEANEARLKAWEDAAEKLYEVEREGRERREKILAESAEREAEIAQNRADAIEKIERNFAAAWIDAVGERDALAGYRAKLKREEEIADQDKADQRATERLQQQLEKQLATQQEAYDRQYAATLVQVNREARARQKDYLQAEVDAQNAANVQTAMQQHYTQTQMEVAALRAASEDAEVEAEQKANLDAIRRTETHLNKIAVVQQNADERKVRQLQDTVNREGHLLMQRYSSAAAAVNAEVMLAQYGANAQRQIHEGMWGGINQIAVTWAANTVSTVQRIMGGYFGGGGYYPAATMQPQPFVYSPTINANGLNEQQAEQVAYRAFRTALHEARAGQMGGR